MEHHEEVELISAASLEVNHIHNAICFLEKIKCSLILFSFDEPVRIIV